MTGSTIEKETAPSLTPEPNEAKSAGVDAAMRDNTPAVAGLQHFVDLCSRFGFKLLPITAGKKAPPLLRRYEHEASADPAKIKAWARKWPGCNFGISTSHGLLVVDVDVSRGGGETIAALIAEHPLPATLEQSTPSGGCHLIYRVARSVKQGVDVLGDGLDIRSRGGYIVCSGSATDRGRWALDDSNPIADAPAWLIDRCGKASAAPARATVKLPGVNVDRARERALEWLAACAVATPGVRNETAFKVASRLHELGLDACDCEALMCEYWPCEPMLEPDELRATIRSAYKTGRNPQGSAAPEAVFTAVELEPGALATAGAKPPHYHLLSPAELLSRPRPAWLIRGLLPAQGLAVLFGAPGSGKSFLALDLAAAIARGAEWAPGCRAKAAGVVLVGLEGSSSRRVAAYLATHSLQPDALAALRIVERQTLNLLDPRGADSKALIEDVRAVGGAAVVVIDTLARAMPGGNENAPDDMGLAIAAAGAISNALNCLVLMVHHSGKDQARGARGHSSLLGAADAELEVSRAADGSTRVLELTKSKEGEDGQCWTFRLRSVDLGAAIEHDPDATPWDRETSCVVDGLAPALAVTPAPRVKLGVHAVNALRALREVMTQSLADSVPVESWSAQFCAAWPIPADGDQAAQGREKERRRKAFSDARSRLQASGLVTVSSSRSRATVSLTAQGRMM